MLLGPSEKLGNIIPELLLGNNHVGFQMAAAQLFASYFAERNQDLFLSLFFLLNVSVQGISKRTVRNARRDS